MDFDKNNKPHFDKNNNPYKIIENLRITYVEADSENTGGKNDVIRIEQAFNDETKPALIEAEIPLVNADTLRELIYGLIHLYIFEKNNEPGFTIRRPR